MYIGVGISGHISYSVVSYLYVRFGRVITLVGEERADFSALDYSLLCGLSSERFPLPLGA